MAAKPPPAWMVRFNIALLGRGLKLGSQHLLTVPGRRTGRPRSTPISIATVDGARYIVAAFADAAWVANVRAARSGTLIRGARAEAIALTEVPVEEREPSASSARRRPMRSLPGPTATRSSAFQSERAWDCGSESCCYSHQVSCANPGQLWRGPMINTTSQPGSAAAHLAARSVD